MGSKKLKLIDDLRIVLSSLEEQAMIEDNQDELKFWQDFWFDVKIKIDRGEFD